MKVGCLLFAARLLSFWQSRGIHPIDTHVDFFPVYSTSTLITANQMNLCSNIPHLCTVSILNKTTRFKESWLQSSDVLIFICFPVWQLWDIESNSGPDSCNGSSHFPCGVCDADVGWECLGICCDTCNIWYHIDCQDMSSTMYSILNKSSAKNIVWECMKCGMPNVFISLFDTTASLETHNRYDSLSSLSHPESPIPDIIVPPPPHCTTAASSPIVQGHMEAKRKATKLP